MDSLKIWLSLILIALPVSSFSTEQHSQIKFRTKSIVVQNIRIKVAVADSPKKRERGLMFVENWNAYQGMIFVFEKSQVRSFWMRNTLLPLSLGFYDSRKRLIEVRKLNPAKSLAQRTVDQVKSSRPAQYVLEVSQGWFKKNKIKVGSKLQGI